jgi:hypothetical protein
MRTLKCCFLLMALTAMTTLPALAAETEGLSSTTTINRSDNSGQSEVISLDDNCNLITFEGMGNDEPIGMVAGPVNVTFGASWLSLIDGDDGGSGNFANEPSSFTAAYFLDTEDISITLDPPVQFLEFWYVASAISLPVTVTAYDANGDIVDTAVGNTVGTSSDGADCVGDPNGTFCLWDVVTLNADADNIVSIEILGSTANQFGFDNLQFCTVAQNLVSCCLPDFTCAELTAEGCAAAGGTVVDVPCDSADCQTVSTDEKSWDLLKSQYR